MSAAAEACCATREMCTQNFGWATCFEIAIAIGKTNYAIRIRDVQKLRIVTRRIKSDPERFVQILFCKNFIGIGLAAALRIAQYLDLVRATLHNKDVAV